MNWTIIIIALVAFGIGYLFAMLDRRVTNSMKESRDARREPKVVEKIVPDQSALSLALDAAGQPKLRLDGETLQVGQVTVEQRKRLIGLLNLIRPWVDAEPLPAGSPPAAVAAAAPGSPAAPTSDAQKPPQVDVMRGVRSIMHDAVITQTPSQGSGIISQIDAVLQEKLAAGDYGGKFVSLEEGPAGEVIVVVGAQRYDGIDAVPDPAIQAVIRESISEWEKRGGR